MLLFAQKTSQVALHMSVAFGVTYAFTGSAATGGLAAILEPVCNVLLLPLHDQLWTRLHASSRKDRLMHAQADSLSSEPDIDTRLLPASQ